MAWTSTGSIRIVGPDKVYKASRPAEWYCDPCNASDKRFLVRWHPGGEWSAYRWFEVITPLDSARDRFAKWQAAKQFARVLNLRWEVDRLFNDIERGYRDTEGGLARIREIIAS